jgi:2,4-dienoyl-CoA reductase-like NADH-dependent reductase (Old Yellow Enzyme family)/thioredoxin reductase
MASASALALARVAGTGSSAMASDAQDGEMMPGGLSDRYQNLLSPVQIGNVVLKNRMLSTRSLPSYLLGPENYPTDPIISHLANVARSGAAVVTVSVEKFDIDDSGIQNYMAQLTDAIHFYGAKANVCLTQFQEPRGYSISDITPEPTTGQRKYFMFGAMKEMPVEMIKKMNADFATKAKQYQDLGFDMACIYMSYRSSIFATSLSKALNKRTDQYGGSTENRARILAELCEEIKKACGPDFLIEAQVSGEDTGGYTLEDLVDYAKMWEGAVDILQVRGWDVPSSHPMGYNAVKGAPLTLRYAEAIKKSGVNMAVAPVGGFQNLDDNEAFIADGKTDLVAMARAFICDPEYGQKAYEGRGEDVVPCILCNKCHGNIYTPHLDVCSVNPKLGFAHKMGRMISAPAAPRKVAVIGGGPAGMKAALTAAERGHRVTLYEKSVALGGLLKHSDFASFQWPLKDYKDYLIRQVEKAGVEVLLNTEATPEMVKKKKYDVILAAVGADPVIPRISGADGAGIYSVVDVFGRHKALGDNVVVIGGGLIGTETGVYLAEKGHGVTVLTNSRALMTSEGNHQDFDGYLGLDNFSFVTEAVVQRISGGRVIYTDAGGSEKAVKADSVVAYAGFTPKRQEAMAFAGAAKRLFTIGDCDAVGGLVRSCTRTAFAAASRI